MSGNSSREWRQKNPEKCKEYHKRSYQNNKEEWKKRSRKWAREHPDRVRKLKLKNYYKNRKRLLFRAKERALKLKSDILIHYGNGRLACVLCGFDRLGALSIDHVHGGGNAHRKSLGPGASIYAWLKRNNYPDGFRTLCMNCQFLEREKIPGEDK